ncbi:glycosyltransferase family 4 protein [Vibrio sp. 10N.286.49.F3]|uniref:glycosyltransferase family 4 protein n=1 Tax=Vibrio sp. 10N.286.49.F3 TaxID=3229704 RepID=UPI00354ED4C3
MKLVVDARGINDSGIGVYIKNLVPHFNLKYKGTFKYIVNPQGVLALCDLGVERNNIIIVEFTRFSWKNLFYLNQYITEKEMVFFPCLTVLPVFSCSEFVSTIHDLCPIRMSKHFGIKISIVFYLVMLFQILKSSRIIAISEFTKQEVFNCFPFLSKKKCKLVYNGVVKRAQSRSKSEISGIKPIKPYFLCVGNIKPHKNILNFANFFSELSKHNNDFDLVVVGSAEGFITGEKRDIPNSDNIIFTGYVGDDELAMLYKNAALFISPSLYEGFGLPIFEAVNFEIPIFLSDIPVYRELAPKGTLFFEPNSFSDFDSKVGYALNNKASYDKKEFLDSFSWENTAKSTIEVIVNHENITSK